MKYARPPSYTRSGAREWSRRRWAALAAADWRCAHCGRQFAPTLLEVDHKEPLWRGGEDSDANLQVLCRRHHADKTGREARERMAGRPRPEHTPGRDAWRAFTRELVPNRPRFGVAR